MKKRFIFTASLFFSFFLFMFIAQNSLVYSQEKDLIEKQETGHTYLITLPHTSETCLQMLDEISKEKPEALNKIEWGCMSGDHTGYMTVKSQDEKTALNLLPSAIQKKAKIEKVGKFTKEQIRSFHKKLD